MEKYKDIMSKLKEKGIVFDYGMSTQERISSNHDPEHDPTALFTTPNRKSPQPALRADVSRVGEATRPRLFNLL